MIHSVHPARTAGPRRGAGRRHPARRAGARRSSNARRPRAFFFAHATQQVTSGGRPSLPLGDLFAAGTTLGALVLWGVAIHLLA
jgi:hypothetical protein